MSHESQSGTAWGQKCISASLYTPTRTQTYAKSALHVFRMNVMTACAPHVMRSAPAMEARTCNAGFGKRRHRQPPSSPALEQQVTPPHVSFSVQPSFTKQASITSWSLTFDHFKTISLTVSESSPNTPCAASNSVPAQVVETCAAVLQTTATNSHRCGSSHSRTVPHWAHAGRQ